MKKNIRKRKTPVTKTVVEAPQKKEVTPDKKLTFRKNMLYWLIPVLIVAALLYYFKGLLVAATVNGQPISRLTIIKDLEKSSGKQVLRSEILRLLLVQEAKKKNITISQSEVDAQLKKIEDSLKKQGQDLDQALAAQGMSRTDLSNQVEQQIILEKLLAKQVTVSDKEISDYIDKNKSNFPEGTTEEQMKTQAATQLKDQKFNTEANKLLDSLLKQAKINYFVNYP